MTFVVNYSAYIIYEQATPDSVKVFLFQTLMILQEVYVSLTRLTTFTSKRPSGEVKILSLNMFLRKRM